MADSAYRFVVIGNHFNNASTTVQILGPGNPNKAYVYVDAVCLSTEPEGCPMGTSIQESAAEDITLWPNPASDWLRIGWGREPLSNVVVMDALGKRVVEHQVLGSNEIVLSVHDLPKGLYHLLFEGNGVKHSRKFVVMH